MEFVLSLWQQPVARKWLSLLALLLGSWLIGIFLRRLVLPIIHIIVKRTPWQWDDVLFDAGVFKRFIRLIPPLIFYNALEYVPNLSERGEERLGSFAMAIIILFLMRAVSAVLTATERLQHNKTDRPIKGYLQLVNIVVYMVGVVIIIATLTQREAWPLLSGLGALSAVLLLVFKDTILGFVASVQLNSNDMLRIGDWIEMPSAGADGDVIDISLHTVKVRNFDQTIITIPTWRMISESYKNWRGMFEAGGRRIKRSLLIDATSVHFISAEETQKFAEFRLLDRYIRAKKQELLEWNEALGQVSPVNQRRLTNLGSFRTYAQAYIDTHKDIHRSMPCMVRQLASEGAGIPVEVYCFTSTTAWVRYERIQGDIFDHLYAILPEFGLRHYQKPTGIDVREAAFRSSAMVADVDD